MCHFIFDYNYGNSQYILIHFCIFGNRNEYSAKKRRVGHIGLNIYVSTLCDKTKNSTKNSQPLTAVRCVETNFCRKSFNAHFKKII